MAYLSVTQVAEVTNIGLDNIPEAGAAVLSRHPLSPL